MELSFAWLKTEQIMSFSKAAEPHPPPAIPSPSQPPQPLRSCGCTAGSRLRPGPDRGATSPSGPALPQAAVKQRGRLRRRAARRPRGPPRAFSGLLGAVVLPRGTPGVVGGRARRACWEP